jgi:DNA-binding PadR family transcriptional regulator
MNPMPFDKIVAFLTAQNPDLQPMPYEVEDALEAMIRNGIVETLWDEDGNTLYRLTNTGREMAEDMKRQYGW